MMRAAVGLLNPRMLRRVRSENRLNECCFSAASPILCMRDSLKEIALLHPTIVRPPLTLITWPVI
jgi:hypothetical protein